MINHVINKGVYGGILINGNAHTTQFRQYSLSRCMFSSFLNKKRSKTTIGNPRLGRWKSIDPLAGKYPGQSPYASFNNNPVFFTDPQAAARLRTRGLGNRPTGCRKMLKTEVFMRQKKEWRFTLG